MTGLPNVSRADLLRCIRAKKYLDIDQAASALGFVRNQPSHKTTTEGKGVEGSIVQPPHPDPHTDPILPPVEQEKMHFYRVTQRELLQTEPATSTGYPDWYEAGTDTLLNEGRESLVPKHQPLSFKPLVPWARLWPFLHKALGNLQRSRALDVERLIKKLARGELIRKLPHKVHYAWSGSVRLLIDINNDTFPLRHDFIFLYNKLIRMRGVYGLHVQYLDDQPGEAVYYWDNGQAVVERWSAPEPWTPFLILSDLGALSRSKRILNNWLVFGRRLAAKGCRPTVLMPVPVRMIDARLLTYFDCVSWDKGGRLKKLMSIDPDKLVADHHHDKVNQLLNRLAPAIRVNHALLRETRYQPSEEHFDIGHEAAVWQHPAIQCHGDEFVWRSVDHENFLQAFRKLPDQLQQTMIDLIARYHAQLPEVVYFEAIFNCIQLASSLVDQSVKDAAERYMAVLVRTCQEHPEYQGLKKWEGRFLGRQKADVLRRENKIIAAIEGIRLKRTAQVGEEITYPVGINKELIMPFLVETKQNETFELRQQGRQLILSPKGNQQGGDGFDSSGCLLTETVSRVDYLLRHSTTQQHLRGSHILKFDPERKVMIALAGTRNYELETDLEKITIEPLIRPDWATLIGNNAHGLYAASKDRDSNAYTWYWNPPSASPLAIQDTKADEGGQSIKSYRGFWYSKQIDESYCPPWAKTANRDQYGLYADVEIFGITQRFRWIEPASFLMGSPKEEKGRDDDETQHSVILTQGYWLADTACTQALWEAVMNDNPSEFKGGIKPVESVSWDDIEGFFKELNKHDSELKLRLPSEAEWENACRAGTTSPFNFGGDLSIDKVNYRSIWEFEPDKWGEGALQQTVEVKSYPPNAWGLYEMHGNVLEWCQDWYEDYPAESVVDPQGRDSDYGYHRVLRGGSWFSRGRYCRSACRNLNDPSGRNIDFGFRLARSH